jgi:hypothetical protein
MGDDIGCLISAPTTAASWPVARPTSIVWPARDDVHRLLRGGELHRRFVFVQQEVARFGGTFIEFPPMQKPASFNLEAIKEQALRAVQAHHGQ